MRISCLLLTGIAAALLIPDAASGAPGTAAKRQSAGALKGQAGDPVPSFGPQPSWVEEPKVPNLDPKHKEDPFQFLLSSSQEYLTPNGLENFVEYVVQPLNQAGLQAIGNVTIPWNVDRTDLTLNRISIERDGKTVDALNRGDVSVIRRETKLDQSTLNGIRTVIMPVRGLQVGDRLRVAFTYKTRPGVLGKTEEVQDMVVPVSIGRVTKRFVVSKDSAARWSVGPDIKGGETKESASTIERVFSADAAEPLKKRSFVPERFKHQLVQVSTFRDWNEVAALLAPSFDQARKTAPNSHVTALADKIATAHKSTQERLVAALRAAQDDVRYVALLLGDGNYKPMSADEVWAQRYGDCKGKTAFLLALLDRLGIQAEPVLASVQFDDGIGQRLPTLALFDHVYVRARIGPDIYYLDGTKFGQRTLDDLRQSTTTHILPLVANSDLATVPDVLPSAPLAETTLVWDARKNLIEKIPFEATLTLRGATAADMRAEAAVSSDRDKLIEKFKDKVGGIANDKLEYVSSEPENPDGSFVVKFKGAVDFDWSRVDGLKGNRLQLTQSTLTWDGEFDRDDDGGKTIPVSMAFPYWERMVEKVLLPNGGKDFTLDASRIDQTVAATRMSREVSMDAGVVTSVSDFKRLQRELDPATARAAKETLGKIGKDYAYIVSRKKLKLPD